MNNQWCLYFIHFVSLLLVVIMITTYYRLLHKSGIIRNDLIPKKAELYGLFFVLTHSRFTQSISAKDTDFHSEILKKPSSLRKSAVISRSVLPQFSMHGVGVSLKISSIEKAANKPYRNSMNKKYTMNKKRKMNISIISPIVSITVFFYAIDNNSLVALN